MPMAYPEGPTMKTILPATLAATAMLLASVPADAGPRNGRGQRERPGAWTDVASVRPAYATATRPACRRPGLARVDDDDDDDDGRRDAAEAILREVVRGADGPRTANAAQALAIIGTLMGLALIERQARERDVAVAPGAAGSGAGHDLLLFRGARPGPRRSRPAPRARPLRRRHRSGSDRALGPVAETFAPSPPVTAPVPSVPRIVPWASRCLAPLPHPQEEAILSDVFRRAADEGRRGY
jgi:hypothetical protein